MKPLLHAALTMAALRGTAAALVLGLVSGCPGGPSTTPRLAFTVQPTTAVAGAAVSPAIEVAIVDAAGNVDQSANWAVTIAVDTNAGSGTLPGTLTVNAVAGVATFGDLSIGKAGTGYTLLATAAGAASATSLAFDIAAGPPSAAASSLTVSPTTVVADGVSTTTLTVTVRDAHGNPVAAQPVLLDATGSANTLLPSSGLTDATGVFAATLASAFVENKAISASVAGGAGFVLTTTVAFTLGPPDQATSQFTGTPATLTADGLSTTALTVTVRDVLGRILAGQPVALQATGSANTFLPSSGLTDPSGVFTATLASTKAETKTVSAAIGSTALTTTVVFVPGPPRATQSSLVASPRSVPPNGTSTATISMTVKDAQGNPIFGRAVSLVATGSANALTPASGVTDGNGVFTATLASTKAEMKTVTATSQGLVFATTVTFASSVCGGTLLLPSVPMMSATGSLPAVGDFNGDGKADFAVANWSSNTISVRLGRGDGTFQPQVTYASAGAFSVTTGDLNGDGKADLVVANMDGGTGSGNVSIFLGNGNGTFQFQVAYGAQAPLAVTAGDFNGDGKTDLAVANGLQHTVGILLGNGDGTLQPQVTYATGMKPSSIATGDFNSDGKTDLAIGNSTSASLSVLLGNGDGTLQPQLTSSLTGTDSLWVGDFNADGKADLVLVTPATNSVSVRLGNGNGTFQPEVAYAVGAGPASVTPGDFNGDGKTDLAVANSLNGSDSISILLGYGDGTFQSQVIYAAGHYPGYVATGDFNGDGKTDLVVTGDMTAVLFGNGDGTFRGPASYATGDRPNAVSVGDFNGDGKRDLAITNPNDSTLSVLLGNGDGTFQPQSLVLGVAFPLSIAIADFNGDGKTDLAVSPGVTPSNYVSILLGNGNGTFQTPVSFAAGQDPVAVATADFNGDGKTDLAVSNDRASGTASILLGNGNGTFQAPVSYAAGQYPFSVATGDFNGDGKSDVVVTNTSGGTISVFIGNGDGTLQSQTTYNAGSSARSVTPADLNGDGKTDLAVANYLGGTVGVFIGNGDGTLQPQRVYPAGNYPVSLAVADLNGDGTLDLAVADAYRNAVGILRGYGNGTFQAPASYIAGKGGLFVAAGDFDDDGTTDLAVTNGYDDNVSILLQTGCLP